MKLKKALSGILAAAMVVSLTPAMAFASTTNTVATVPTVSTDTELPEIQISAKVTDETIWATGSEQILKLNFKNAEWNSNPTSAQRAAAVGVNSLSTDDGNITITVTDKDGDSTSPVVTFKNIYSVSDNSIEFGIDIGTEAIVKDDVINFNIGSKVLKSLSEAGPVEIAIDGLDSKFTSSSVTVATVGTGKTVATTNGDAKSYARRSAIKVNTTIEIREASVNALESAQIIKMTLPKGVEWADVDYSGSFGPGMNGAISSGSAASGTSATDTTPLSPANNYYLNDSKTTLYLYVPFTANDSQRQVLTIQPYITITKDASFGDISVDIDGWRANSGSAVSSAADLLIAAYGDESVTVSTDETVPSIVAGFEKTNKDKPNWVRVTLKENIAKALAADRPIDFSFPSEVQVVPTATTAIKCYIGSNPDRDKATSLFASDLDFDGATNTKDRSNFTLTMNQIAAGSIAADFAANQTANKASTVTLYIPVTVKADFEGDITLNISGAKAGVDDTDLVVATVVPAISVVADTTEVKNGVQSQALSDVVITENVAGYLGKTGTKPTLLIKIDSLDFGGISITDADVAVTDGDLELGKKTINAGVISVEIKEASSKASTITISNVKAALNRVLPEGPYAVEVYGKAVIDNGTYNNNKFADPTVAANGDVYAAKVDGYLNIVTPAESTTVSEKVDAKFVIGEASYTNNGETTEMDAAAYIDSHNRTMVPIRYVANACGISENDIRWEQNTQTAIINGLNTVVTVKMGSNKLQTSTGEITMDTVAVNNNGRIYVPVRYIANALGANVSWDAATKTVTLTK